MNPSDHERCSELLADHVRGDLSAADRTWVNEHLAACDECRAEESALHALALEDVPPLTELERAGLRRAALASSGGDVARPAMPAPVASGGRLLQVLGAAALLLIIGVFMYSSGLLGSGGDGLGDTAGGDAGESAEAPQVQDAEALEAESGAAAGRTSAADSGAPAPQPTFKSFLGEISGRRLNKLGREGLPLVIFSRAYDAAQVPGLQAEFRDRLAVAAGPQGDIVKRCSDLVTQAFPNSLPAYGALATLEKLRGRKVLVLAFAWTDEPSGPLDQSMVWAWPADDCDQPVEYFKNVIQPKQ